MFEKMKINEKETKDGQIFYYKMVEQNLLRLLVVDHELD